MVPSGWSIKKLGDICDVKGGKRLPKGRTLESSDTGYPYIRVTDMYDGGVDTSSIKYIPQDIAPSIARYTIGKDDLFITVAGTLGVAGEIPDILDGANLTENADKLTNLKVDKSYLLSVLRSPIVQRSIEEEKTSNAQPKLAIERIKEFLIPCPPDDEQRKIAKILSTWDKAIATTERLLANSQQQKQALAQQLLTGRKRHKQFANSWETYRLGDLFERIIQKNTEGNTNVVTISAQHGLIRQDEFFKKTVASATLEGYYLLSQGQFAYNKSYSNGYPMGAIKRLNRYGKGVVTTLYICFAVRDAANCCPLFFEQFFDAGLLNEGLAQIAHEGGRAHGLLNVKPADFFSLKVKVPTLQEQQKIAQVLSTADAEISNLQAQLAKLKLEKKALMQQLLTGQRRVKPDAGAAA